MGKREDMSSECPDAYEPRRFVTLLNSRQSKRPCAVDAWVEATVRAVDHLLDDNTVFLSSVGMNTWELLVHLVNVKGGRQLILLPASWDENNKLRIIESFRLDSPRTEFAAVETPSGSGKSTKSWWTARDRQIVRVADTLVPISLRPGGGLATLLRDETTAGQVFDNRFRAPYSPASDKVEYSFDPARLNSAIEPHWNYLTHWTRASHAAYPGESNYDYYQSILDSSRYRHSALDTLMRIVRARQVTASSRFIRGGYSVVSFTSLHPFEAVKLMRWRRRYVYYNFEPYGIAIEREIAVHLRMRPVIYGDGDTYDSLPAEYRCYYQTDTTEVADWRPETEWRHLGDFDFSQIPHDKIKLLVYRPEDAAPVETLGPYEVIPLTLT
jgi:hypothetical protein